MKRLVLSLLVENNPGVLSRVAGLFTRRGYGIDSLNVGTTNEPNISRMTVVATGDERILDQIQKQLNKLVEVIEIFPLPEDESVFRELMLVKVETTEATRPSVVSICDIFRSRIIDVSPNCLTIEITGDKSKIDAFIAMLDGFNIIEMVRTGVSGLKRGMNVFNNKEEKE